MFTDIYNINKINEEAGLYLSSLEDKSEIDETLISKFKMICINIASSDNPAYILTLLKRYYEKGILTPLTLTVDEFDIQEGAVSPNKRFPDIRLHTNGKIEYTNAFIPKIQHIYNIDTNEEVPVCPNYLDVVFDNNCPIWITRGGCCVGEYIANVFLKESTVAKHCFTPHAPIYLPLSLEIGKGYKRWSVDAREPKLKTIREYYDTVEYVINEKFDIRKYKKLK